MIDPVSAMAVAGTAFSAIKKGIQLGKDVEFMYGDIGSGWVQSLMLIKQRKMQKIHHYTKKYLMVHQ